MFDSHCSLCVEVLILYMYFPFYNCFSCWIHLPEHTLKSFIIILQGLYLMVLWDGGGGGAGLAGCCALQLSYKPHQSVKIT